MKVNSEQKPPIDPQRRGGMGLVQSSILARKNPRAEVPLANGRAANLLQREAQNAIHPPNAAATQGLAHSATGSSQEQLSLQKARETRVTEAVQKGPRRTDRPSKVAGAETTKVESNVPGPIDKLKALEMKLKGVVAEEQECSEGIESLKNARGLFGDGDVGVNAEIEKDEGKLRAIRVRKSGLEEQIEQARAALQE